MEDLPREMIETILSFNPGIDVGKLSQVSKRIYVMTKHFRRRMYLIYKVRDILIQKCYNSLVRHLHYWYWEAIQEMHDPFHAKPTERLTLKEYHQKLIERQPTSQRYSYWYSRKCYGCHINVGRAYYVLLGKRSKPRQQGSADQILVYRYCYNCYCRGIVLYYNIHNTLPVTRGSCEIVDNLIKDNYKWGEHEKKLVDVCFSIFPA